MLSNVKKELNNRNNVSLFLMDAEKLGFKDGNFDYVMTTFVLCSIPDPVISLREMKRVCKPDGIGINLEHMRSENRFIAFIEDLVNPITKSITGVNINRKTVENIKKADLDVIDVKNMALSDVFRLI
ncbi:class I SAM-dependent methyltransferase [Methanolobus psychrotolerans]|uniref:class I SAM-dependent methyltransferase n=1 Tax=Methanolobus psychrotolerans TaxID=1874706 RepID=UPI0024143889|nr:class I SAM-dependent methyltransferase [Methanolobus psychrotolerans]